MCECLCVFVCMCVSICVCASGAVAAAAHGGREGLDTYAARDDVPREEVHRAAHLRTGRIMLSTHAQTRGQHAACGKDTP